VAITLQSYLGPSTSIKPVDKHLRLTSIHPTTFDMFAALHISRRKEGLSSSATKDFSVPCNQHVTSSLRSARYTKQSSPPIPQRRLKFKCSRSKITVSSNQHPDMLDMIEELYEPIDEIQNFTYTKKTSGQLDTLAVGSTAPVSHTQLREIGDVDNSIPHCIPCRKVPQSSPIHLPFVWSRAPLPYNDN